MRWTLIPEIEWTGNKIDGETSILMVGKEGMLYAPKSKRAQSVCGIGEFVFAAVLDHGHLGIRVMGR